jgi:hypothetical protein
LFTVKIQDYESKKEENSYLNVEDISGDEENSVTSTKGEGYGSDFSDSEVRNVGSAKKPNVNYHDECYFF